MRALVTGGSRGIGAALVAEGRARGHDVTGTARDGAMGLDVTDAAAQARLAAATGPLDLLVCNAGIYVDREADIRTITPEQLADSFAVNVTGVVLTVQAQLPNLSRGGRIAVISSQMGSSEKRGAAGLAYRASKAAAINLALNLAEALRPEGIAVGVYHPGWVRTDMGGGSAAISPEDAARGLWDRFETLTLETTGRFETWDGRAHPI
ncbi:SDR family NAD(P)-dependent oxidoreductase [Jannaschia seohaensis]|uniref:NAD(P)-dependent dehydrogenase (Short-subunit alcohol dehydrogenase family) n=1 Tax=Jannaschia seohaensis TaxID=475081 RepID=A0A2Y9C0B8_9RHOB|nr:SDR family NAD(P)-dependent oxidoreductase [Jannaschia seohaensis]PWJ19240.1 NAD(P)-dependent dehydrogenase (short-subunit alcohol dehydrogenase family) [Jannaschia seohaensis]SSA45902.1 NAD(P)-dependent dehydrogenase, short-chain alcohol dehydrogenase family [Jannaschia seohaensis]